LTNERFLVPEVLFSPTDIGINQLGIGEMIKQITSKRVPSSFEHIMFGNIVIGGGNTKTPGFKERLENEILNQGLMTDMA
jgi:actin-related protein 6